MNEDSPWEMVVCEYCFERMHRTRIEEHRNLVHGDVIEAERTISGPTQNEKKGILAMGVWIGLVTLFVIVLVSFGVESGLPYALACAGIFIGLGVIGLAIQISTPSQVKEARRRAREVIHKRLVACDVCDGMVSFENYSDHIKRYHPEKMPYEWFRAATLILLVLIGGGGYVASSLLAASELLSDGEMMLLVIGWLAGTCLILLLVFYEYHVGEPKRIQRMRRHWEEHRFDSKDGRSR